MQKVYLYMVKIANKVKQFLILPSFKKETGHSASLSNVPSGTGFCKDGYPTPSGRKNPENIPIVPRTLTANMTGIVTLTGTSFNLNFKKGSLTGISRNRTPLIEKMHSCAYFTSSDGIIRYRMESSFSFDGETEYGLRTLQIPKAGNSNHRIFTDYTFCDEYDDAVITIVTDYPDFLPGTSVLESAVFETPVFRIDESGIEVTADNDSDNKLIITPETGGPLCINGSSFCISASGISLDLTLLSDDGKKTEGKLPLKTGHYRGERYLFINPGGSYEPVPAECLSGLREKISFRLNIRKTV